MVQDRALSVRYTSRRLISLAYVLVWLVPVLGLAVRIAAGTLQGDLFEHAAAVRALAADPIHPSNPLFASDAPHTLFSPYSLLLALLVRATALDPFQVLSFAGFFNAVILAVGFRAFVRIFTRSDAAAVLAAIFAIFLWGSASLPFGRDPWIWSGFLNLSSLTYGLPYPSTLAMGLAFIAIAVAARAPATPRSRDLLTIGILQAVIVIMHPYTAAFTGTAVVSILVSTIRRSTVRRAVLIVAALSGGTAIAFAWPYYPVGQLLAGQSTAFDWEQQEMYAFVIRRTYPALIGLAFIAVRAWRNPRDPLVVLLVGLGVIYGFGYVSGRFTLGRELPFLMLDLDVALALGLTDLWHGAADQHAGVALKGGLMSRGVVVAVALVVTVTALLGIRTDLTTGTPHAGVEQMARRTPPTDVVLADPSSNYAVPAWGGKVVAWGGAVGFIPDIQQRRADATAFFVPTTTQDERDAILSRYHVQWILFDRSSPTITPSLEAAIDRLGTPAGVSLDGKIVLLRVP